MRMQAQKSYSAKPSEVDAKWWIIDAEDAVLGRMAVIVADRLRGKHKPMFTPNIDCGDHIIIINAEKVYLSGNKKDNKVYHRHTGYPGGLKSRTAGEILEGDHSDRVIRKAVERMLPKTKMGRAQLKKLKVYPGPDHPHESQQPENIDIAALSAKNKRND